jgi:hypothetical protein
VKKVSVLSALFALIASPVSASAVGPVGSPTVHKTKIACFVPETNRYVGKVEPSKCELWGRVEFVGFLEGENTEEFEREAFSRVGLKEIEWRAGWGRSVDKGSASLDRSGRGTFVDAYRRVKCADGSTWYAKANVYKETGVYYELQLPVCGRPLSARS